MSAKLRRRVDPEDVVQSAYRSFFVHAENEEYRLLRSGDLWRLLAGITLNKLYGQIEKQTAAKRSFDREEATEVPLAEVKALDPSAAEIVAIVEQLNLEVDALSADERTVFTARLQGESINEICKLIGKSDRTVRRLLGQAKKQLEQKLLTKKAILIKKVHRAPEPHAPLQHSDYIIEQLLGAGGMGKVYRAKEKNSGKQVALKSLHKSQQFDRRAVGQFVQEAQILAKLKHPGIIGVQGLGRFPGGGYFIVMDLVDGVDLQSRLSAGPLPLSEAVLIVKDVAIAVQHAHDHGIIHCDLKPGNILLDRNNHVFVMDFGFAYMITSDSQKNLGGIGGTTGYIAPEVLRLKSQPTHAADIYALGVLLWVLVFGKLPETLVSLDSKSDEKETIQLICRRCLAENPSERYSSANEMLVKLEKLISV